MRNGLRRGALGVLCAAALLAATSPESPVADAAMRGDLEAVRALVRQGVDVNAPQGDGTTALHWAAERGDAEMARLLLYAGAHVRATTRLGGHTALHMASRAGHADVVRLLLQGGSPADARTSTGVTPLHFAAASGNVESLRLLLDAGAVADAREGAQDQTPLMFAAAAGRVASVELLLARGADFTAQSRVVDYAAQAAVDQEDRQRRTRLLQAQRESAESSAGQREGATRQAAEVAAPPAEEAPAEGEPAAEPAGQANPAAEEAPAGEAAAEEPAAEEPAEEDPAEEDPAEKPEEPAAEEPAEQEAAPAEQEPSEQPATEPGAGFRGRQAGAGAGGAEANEPRPLSYAELVGSQGGLTALHYAVRQGHHEVVRILLDAGADLNRPTGGDRSTPLFIATVNGHYDLAMWMLERGADPNLATDAGATPLYATLNNRWAPKALYPQPTAFQQQRTSYMELMEALLERGADPNAQLSKHLWYTSFNFDLLGVDMHGATPFWRAAYATDVPAMRLLVRYGADPGIATTRLAERQPQGGGGFGGREEREDQSGVPPVPPGGPAVFPLHAASGVGYGQEFAANAHRHAPGGWLPAVRYLVEELGADVNQRDHNGYTALHHAASRGDNELILYLVERGADVMVVSRRGQTTADMANGPQQRVLPYPETVALLEKLGSQNNNNCVGC